MVDDTVGGYRTRRGTLIGISIYTMQRDPRWRGPDADSYEPMRFYDMDIVAGTAEPAFMPFGAGPHRCFSAAMGYLQAQFLLAQIDEIPDTNAPEPGSPARSRPALAGRGGRARCAHQSGRPSENEVSAT
jgi:cytochrome P450